MIKDRCGKVYSPGKSLSMDESLCAIQGKTEFQAVHQLQEGKIWNQVVSILHIQWYTSRFHCAACKPGTRISLLRKLFTDYSENSSNSHAETLEQETSSLQVTRW